ncbi:MULTISPECIES: type VI secretion system baseplate subunit TssG [unclassified Pseudomonas]|uniref:type VI secretion system baseplate subunit TssG n=1 Tax=unclassified Pseudomonas TaxID=196821 RepID=UPI000A1F7818|nr:MULTISPECIES: type VI secretion system baseplate subunit TssG [unclassified Pseudomonas]MDI2143344.1 type VI secretion system baseplate subunit TssG [Pseudomonas sp. ITA]
MATPSRHAPVALTLGQRLRRDPQAFEWLQALLLLEREQPQADSLGSGTSPQAEALKLRGPLTPVFAASQIESLEEKSGEPLTLNSPMFGLGGPDGPLPYAYQEWLQQRARAKDHAPAEFLDLFQHRLLSLLYKVMRKHRIALGFTTPGASPVQAQLRALTGLMPKSLQERQAIPDCAVLACTALYADGRRSLAGFAAIVREQFSVPVELSAYEGAWREIPAASRSVMKAGGRNLQLGRTAVAGTRVWDEHAGIRLTLGPLSSAQAARFLPDGEAHPALASLAALYFGPDLDVKLVILVRGAGPLKLSRQAPALLSWNGGLQRQASVTVQRIETRLRQLEIT